MNGTYAREIETDDYVVLDFQDVASPSTIPELVHPFPGFLYLD
jgi:hypothetical protein